MVAGDVGVQLEVLGDLGRLHAVRRGPHEEVDLAPGGVAERARDRDDRGRELVRAQVGRTHGGILPTP